MTRSLEQGWGEKWVERNPFSNSGRGVLGFMLEYLPEVSSVVLSASGRKNQGLVIAAGEEIWQAILEKGYGNVRRHLEEDLTAIAADPYGERSVDPDRKEERAQSIRSINRLSDWVKETAGYQVVVKAFGRDWKRQSYENYVEQYLLMRLLSKKNPDLEQWAAERTGNSKLLSFAQSAGIIRIGNGFQYLFLEEAAGERLVLPYRDINGLKYPVLLAKDHPDLVEYTRPGKREKWINWEDFEERVKTDVGFDLVDFKPRNVIVTRDSEGRKKYRVIDQMVAI